MKVNQYPLQLLDGALEANTPEIFVIRAMTVQRLPHEGIFDDGSLGVKVGAGGQLWRPHQCFLTEDAAVARLLAQLDDEEREGANRVKRAQLQRRKIMLLVCRRDGPGACDAPPEKSIPRAGELVGRLPTIIDPTA